MATQAEKFKEIADAIREVNDRSNDYDIVANNFASEISKLNPKMITYYEDFENGFYGLRAVRCAATYVLARAIGMDKFCYNQTNIFSTGLQVRDGEYARIDCSAFIGLCLRGIPYENSPYAKHAASDATWLPSSELSSMYGTDGWEFTELDKQKEGLFNNIGISGYSTIRTAADLGQYFYRNGRVLYDSAVDGAMSSRSELDSLNLKPGDLIFWSKTTSQSVLGRFKGISHIGMISENIAYYYHVTGTEGKYDETVVRYNQFDDGTDSDTNYEDDESHPIENLVLICRPDYRPRMPKEETPIGVNLLTYPWTYSRQEISTSNGITFVTKGANTIHVSGTNTASFSRKLKGYENTSDCITLSPGTYQVSGMDGTGVKSVGFAIQIRYQDGTDFSTAIRCYDENSPAFTITEETKIISRLYFGSNSGNGYTLDCDITPTLVRIA